MNAVALFKAAQQWGPVLFAVGFLAPLIGQSLDLSDFSAPLGLSNLQLGLVIALPMGLIAKRRGRWV